MDKNKIAIVFLIIFTIFILIVLIICISKISKLKRFKNSVSKVRIPAKILNVEYNNDIQYYDIQYIGLKNEPILAKSLGKKSNVRVGDTVDIYVVAKKVVFLNENDIDFRISKLNKSLMGLIVFLLVCLFGISKYNLL